MLGLSPLELGIVALLVVVLFGAKRLPELSRSMGKSIREFKKATSDVEREITSSIEEAPASNEKLEQTKESDPVQNKA